MLMSMHQCISYGLLSYGRIGVPTAVSVFAAGLGTAAPFAPKKLLISAGMVTSDLCFAN
jgi:hypothetical protein